MWVNSKESRNKGSLPEEKEEELNKTCIVRVSATEKQNNSRLFPFSLDYGDRFVLKFLFFSQK